MDQQKQHFKKIKKANPLKLLWTTIQLNILIFLIIGFAALYTWFAKWIFQFV